MTGNVVFWLSYAVLWAFVLLLSFAVILLLRDLGKRRLVSPDGRKLQGLPVDEAWSGLEVPTPDGPLRLPVPDVSQIIVVAAKRCAMCREAMLALGGLATETGPSLKCLFVYPGTRDEMLVHLGDAPTYVIVIYDTQNVVRRRLGIVAYPYAVAVDDTGRVRDSMIPHGQTDLERLLGALNIRRGAVAMTG